MSMIRVENLGVRFGSFEAAKGIAFSVEKGASFGIVGESGSGKSTVLRALSGLNPDWSGRMEIAGVALTPRRPRDFFRRVQMVFQDPYGSLHPRQTVDRALAEPLRSTASPITKCASCAAWQKSPCLPLSGFAIRTSFPAASASGSPSPAP